jgi:hypothetical protein
LAVDRSAGPAACWPWRGSRDRYGYGQFFLRGRTVPAHRLALEIKLGRPLAPGMLALAQPTCGASCCNWHHLSEGTRAQKVALSVARGRWPRGERSRTAKLTERQARAILRCRGRGAAKRYGISERAVRLIVTGKRWAHLQTGGAL